MLLWRTEMCGFAKFKSWEKFCINLKICKEIADEFSEIRKHTDKNTAFFFSKILEFSVCLNFLNVSIWSMIRFLYEIFQ